MEIQVHKSNIPSQVPKHLAELYPNDLTLYPHIPTDTISIEEMSSMITERMQVLMEIKAVNDRGFGYMSDEWKKSLLENLQKKGLNNYVKLIFYPKNTITLEDINRRKRDSQSFFLILIGFCKTEEKRQCITQVELDMLRLKFQNAPDFVIRDFIKKSKFPYSTLSHMEKEKMKNNLLDSSRVDIVNFDSTEFYKVPYLHAHTLCADLSCFAFKKFLYVPYFEIVSIVEEIYRERINAKLMELYAHSPNFPYDERITPLLNNLEGYSSVTQYNFEPNAEVTVESLDHLSKTSFPLCTRNLYEALKHHHHLKYNGRQILQLFLKGIGLSVEGCLQVFRSEFTKQIDPNKFDKEYAYSIRHNYGLEGSRVNYNPPSCMNIIKIPVQKGEYHGCPFKTWSSELLKKRLIECNVSQQGVNEILDLTEKGHPQLACSKYFQYTHGGTQAAINHPNFFFEESQKYYQKLNKN